MRRISCLVVFSFFCLAPSWAAFSIQKLQVEYQTQPIGIDVTQPSFSWQISAPETPRGTQQSAYRIVVKNAGGEVVWDSEKINSSNALGILYKGKPLKAGTRYHWEVSVWDQSQTQSTASDWFETGLMNDDAGLSAWNGATWIGAPAKDLILYAQYLSVFKLEYSLQLDQTAGTTKAAFLFGGNDPRLMDKNKNIQGVAAGQDQSYIAFELDVAALKAGNGSAKLHVYRAGYAPGDSPSKPLTSWDIPNSLVNAGNMYAPHRFTAECNFGVFDVYLDGHNKENLISKDNDPDPSSPFRMAGYNLNPVGRGNNFISFPMLGEIGFKMAPGQLAYFSDIQVKHFRFPSNTIFAEMLDDANAYSGIFHPYLRSGLAIRGQSYVLSGGNSGVVILSDPSHGAAPMLRTRFNAGNQTLKSARLYVTARGIYEMYLNGQRVGGDYFNPGLTQYNKTHHYQTYDVTGMIRPGQENALGAWLGEGWWSGNITYTGENWNYFGDRQSLLAQLVLTFADGSTQVITSNPDTWKYFADGPVRYGSFFQGEVYDATKEAAVDGWSLPNYDDRLWSAAASVPLEGTSYLGTFTNARGQSSSFKYDQLKISGQIGENARIVKTLTAQSVQEVRPGVFVYDMGQNMVGFPRIQITGGSKGKAVTMRYAEVRYPDLSAYGDQVGMVMMENIRAALTQDEYVLKGGNEVIQPRFTFHGYRFVEISGIDRALPPASVQGLVISSVHGLSSEYKTSNDLVNQLWSNITWSLRSNFLSIPTDTPARNERMGWSGDINVFSRAATYLADVNEFFKRHLLAMRDVQREDGRFTDVAPMGGGFGGTLWGSAGIVVAWEAYQQFGDINILREHYDAMKRYVDFLATKIDPSNGVLNEGPLGDWLSPEGNKNDNTLFWTAYYAYDLDILAKSADLLGKTADAADFRKRYAERKQFFNATYVDPNTHKTIKSGVVTGFMGPPGERQGNVASEKGLIIDTQASYAIPLALDIFDEQNKPYAIQHLAATIQRKNTDDSGVERPEYSLMTGFIGTASLNQALSENGRDDLAYRLLQQQTYPSWLYSVVNGATTIWERLNSYTVEDGFGGNNSMNSFNHYSFGAVAAWMYQYSLGIQRDPASPGFKHFILQPTPDPDGKMTWAEGHYDSPYGRIQSSWKLESGSTDYSFVVPANTGATLYLPAPSAKSVREGGKKLKKSKGIAVKGMENGQLVLELTAGEYHFTVAR